VTQFYAPSPPEARIWQWTTPGSSALQLLTGKPKNKQLWRYDYVSDPPWTYPWSSANANYIALNIPNARAPFYTQRGAEFPPWQFPDFWENADALYLPIVKPFSKLWRYDYVPPTDWQYPNFWENADTLYLPVTEPFSKLWRYDLITDTALWLGSPQSAYTQQQLDYRPSSPTKFWRWDYVPQPDWLGEPQSSVILIELSATPYHKLWRYDVVPQPDWLGTPEGISQQLRNVTPQPFYKLWRYDIVPDPPWQVPLWMLSNWDTAGPPETNPFYKFWRYDYQPTPDWLGEPIATSIGTIPPSVVQASLVRPPVVVGTPPTDMWWVGAPLSQPITLPQLTQLYAPVSGWWSSIPEQTDWVGTPRSTPTSTSPSGNPFFRLWRYDQVPASEWVGNPLASNIISQLAHKPFNKLWRWDYEPDKFWQGTPVSPFVKRIPPPPPPFHKFWRYDQVPATEWVGHQIGSAVLYLPSQVVNQLLRNVIVRTRELVNEIERERELRNVIVRTRVLPFGGPTYH